MSGSTRFASWDANTHGRSSGKTCLPRELRTAPDVLWTSSLLKRRVPTFTLDCTDAYHQAPKLDDVVFEPPEEYLNRLRAAGMSTNIWWKLLKDLPGRRQAGQRWVGQFTSAFVDTLGFTRCVSAPQFFWNPDRQVVMEVDMDGVHGFGPDPQVEKFKVDLAAHIWFRDGGVHRESAEYDHLKRFRKRLNGAMTIESNPKNLDAVSELFGLEVAKDVPTPSVLAHKEKLTTGELLSPAETTVYRQCWRFALLHARQSRCTVRGVNSGNDAGKTDSRIDDCTETRDSLLEKGTRHFFNKLDLDTDVDTRDETGWIFGQ